ncbi:hypothetical protein EMIHUDRAFT_252225 [Emiliania huxleyi CCMP1516]|uniref:Uncharacterized protein n=2 Tax=Emiliania huxleyi TaxID=2903 RepID=A0A0D3KMV7_EMIH1|nr:hypothetical protein EMIHUDRAFT_252225 [Emiliania huxleyi CCMP1516]EOD37092.1 hypothetical protein EMIHUDRAFT_252225 [Emiliania huxleyi CCMP1516]|eukprot:XP_005789521.1 hypothetical protein EMIHUDRAFT_252225 [Emiliania huxleyi CCMP1516]
MAITGCDVCSDACDNEPLCMSYECSAVQLLCNLNTQTWPDGYPSSNADYEDFAFCAATTSMGQASAGTPAATQPGSAPNATARWAHRGHAAKREIAGDVANAGAINGVGNNMAITGCDVCSDACDNEPLCMSYECSAVQLLCNLNTQTWPDGNNMAITGCDVCSDACDNEPLCMSYECSAVQLLCNLNTQTWPDGYPSSNADYEDFAFCGCNNINGPGECWNTCGDAAGLCSKCDGTLGTPGACCQKGKSDDPPECLWVPDTSYLYDGYHTSCATSTRRPGPTVAGDVANAGAINGVGNNMAITGCDVCSDACDNEPLCMSYECIAGDVANAGAINGVGNNMAITGCDVCSDACDNEPLCMSYECSAVQLLCNLNTQTWPDGYPSSNADYEDFAFCGCNNINGPGECWNTCGDAAGLCSKCDGTLGTPGACCQKGKSDDPPECLWVPNTSYLYDGYHTSCATSTRRPGPTVAGDVANAGAINGVGNNMAITGCDVCSDACDNEPLCMSYECSAVQLLCNLNTQTWPDGYPSSNADYEDFAFCGCNNINGPGECWNTCGDAAGLCSKCDGTLGTPGACCQKGKSDDPPECLWVPDTSYLYDGYHTSCATSTRRPGPTVAGDVANAGAINGVGNNMAITGCDVCSDACDNEPLCMSYECSAVQLLCNLNTQTWPDGYPSSNADYEDFAFCGCNNINGPGECWNTCGDAAGLCSKCDGTLGTPGACCQKGKSDDPPECLWVPDTSYLYDGYHTIACPEDGDT